MKALKSQRLHIGFFGKTNAGKSSVINSITGQDVSIVSDIAGTTTDVVEKSMELLPIGAVTLLDTAGINDTSELGKARIEKTLRIIDRTDIGVIVCEYNNFDEYEERLIEKFNELKIPYLILVNKTDLTENITTLISKSGRAYTDNVIFTSATTDKNIIYKFKEELVRLLPEDFVAPPKIAGDLVEEKSTVILVIPIDKEAPKGRIILPQVQVLRDLLDSNCQVMSVKESELEDALNNLKTKPSLVITDSQAFKTVAQIVPEDIALTSFSILFARLKGDLKVFVNGAKAIDKLQDGDKVLILESCTHHAIEDDIGKVKIPNLLRKKTGKELVIEHFSGHEFPDISGYKLIIHCGACMTNRREILSRIIKAGEQNIPITNYGITISYCLGILERATKIFKQN
jgi:[FeFe] hydrogenase H-cluster maturation GTPase HydF